MKSHLPGQRVVVNGHKGTVTSIRFKGNGDQECLVSFDNKLLVGAHEWFVNVVSISENISIECPVCGTKWKITKSPIQDEDWYDCPKCNKTKEELENEYAK